MVFVLHTCTHTDADRNSETYIIRHACNQWSTHRHNEAMCLVVSGFAQDFGVVVGYHLHQGAWFISDVERS